MRPIILLLRKCRGGWCSAQRIKIQMIAGGNHTTIQLPLPWRIEMHTVSDER